MVDARRGRILRVGPIAGPRYAGPNAPHPMAGRRPQSRSIPTMIIRRADARPTLVRADVAPSMVQADGSPACRPVPARGRGTGRARHLHIRCLAPLWGDGSPPAAGGRGAAGPQPRRARRRTAAAAATTSQGGGQSGASWTVRRAQHCRSTGSRACVNAERHRHRGSAGRDGNAREGRRRCRLRGWIKVPTFASASENESAPETGALPPIELDRRG